MAASPQTSLNTGMSEAKTGHPQVIASSSGKPKPSYMEGKMKQTAGLYNRLSSSSLTRPKNLTLDNASSIPFC